MNDGIHAPEVSKANVGWRGTIYISRASHISFAFPPLGHHVGLTQTQFGVWAAIAIHDTSSVVGAASRYGAEALQIATTVKLTRALWIVPLTLGTAFVGNKHRPVQSNPHATASVVSHK